MFTCNKEKTNITKCFCRQKIIIIKVLGIKRFFAFIIFIIFAGGYIIVVAVVVW